MTENITISKAPPPFTSMDFAALRAAGIQHLEKLGSKLWTDYNLHDPGITILEVLCYAITDLGYRTSFPLQDILAAPGNHPDKKQFFTAPEILTCNPVTVNDFRKILIDLNGIKNAWLKKTAKQEIELSVIEGEGGKWKTILGPSAEKKKNIELNGLYDVYIDLDDKVVLQDIDKVDDITQCAWRALWKHRNLCEDFVAVKVVEEINFGIEAKIELCPGADVNKVAGDIYYFIQEYLTPTISFYSFKEMHEQKNKSCEEIFEGPLLCNGFIDDDELEKAQLKNAIYVSDLWQVVMDVCGVSGIKSLQLKNCDDDSLQEWCMEISENHKPKLIADCSKISFQKEFECVAPDERKVKDRIELQKQLHSPQKKSKEMPALEQGMDRHLGDYYSIQDEFPATYKIAEGQLTSTDTAERVAQSKQLKGFLLLFDELLANYLLQLSRVKDLLSISQPEEHSYFYHDLYTVPGVKELINTHKKNWDEFVGDDDNEYIKSLKEIIESPTKQKQRRDIFLNHLLARFGESFTGYVLKIHEEQCNCTVTNEWTPIPEHVLNNKANFLKNIPALSSERGKSFNYKALNCGVPDVRDTLNVEGLKKRVCAYWGYTDYRRKRLSCPPEFEIKPKNIITNGQVQERYLCLVDKQKMELLKGIKDYYKEQDALNDAKMLKERVLQGNIYIDRPDESSPGRVVVKDREEKHALQSELMSAEEANALLGKIKKLAFPECCSAEGFHIVEHILLRPKDDDYIELFDPVDISKEGVHQLLLTDAYSFWITVAVPNWLPSFKDNPNIQYQFEQLVRRETPAHIAVKFCWLAPEQMYKFETACLKWMHENALEHPNERKLTGHVNNLVKLVRSCGFSLRQLKDPCFSEEIKP
ncbi:MAG: hypothetical protein QM791_12815 [Ferruginibacter sp.]